MPKYFVVHKHEYGGSGYQIETDFDLMQAVQDYGDWDLRLAVLVGIDYEPWKDEEIDLCPFEEIRFVEITLKDWLGADVPAEQPEPEEKE